MFKLTKLSDFIDASSTGIKAVVVAITLIGFLAAAIPVGQAVLSLPAKWDEHQREAMVQTVILERALCITVADHRKLDWTLCYTNPDAVLPKGP